MKDHVLKKMQRIGIVLILVVAGAAAYASVPRPLATSVTSVATSTLAAPTTTPRTNPAPATATLLIYDGSRDIFDGRVDIAPSSTVFDAVQKAAARSGIAFTYKESPGLGVFITAIGGRANGDGGAYWQYWLNGAYAEKGAGETKVHAGDRIEWRFTSAMQ